MAFHRMTLNFSYVSPQQWSKHTQELKDIPRLTVDHVSNLKEFLGPNVATGSQLHAVVLYDKLLLLLGPNVAIHHADHQHQNATRHGLTLNYLQKLDISAEQALAKVLKLAKPWIQQRYKWGINWGASLPQGFIFLKRKKQQERKHHY